MIITATVLCTLSVIPILSSVFFTEALTAKQIDQLMTGLVAGTIILVAIGIFFLVKGSFIMDTYKILLQEDDYNLTAPD